MPVPIAKRLVPPAGSLFPTQQQPQRRDPVWGGPCGDTSQSGITQGQITQWLVCRERFRLRMLDGLTKPERFDHKLEFGNMFHLCEEHWLAQAGVRSAGNDLFSDDSWIGPLTTYAQQLCKRWPMEDREIEKWYWTCRTIFPIYVDYWNRHPDTAKREPLLQEGEFRVPYRLPSGRVVQLRGKRDSVDLFDGKVYITDHKTKSDINVPQLCKQLTNDLQCMVYVVATYFDKELSSRCRAPICGIRYNCIRRPLSGKGPTKQLKTETAEGLYQRVGEYVRENAHEVFQRFQVEITPEDVTRFRNECLDPILENICDDWEWWSFCHNNDISPFDLSRHNMTRECEFAGHVPRHYRMPFGVYSPLIDARSRESDLDYYIDSGSEQGLVRTKNLFPELQSTEGHDEDGASSTSDIAIVEGEKENANCE